MGRASGAFDLIGDQWGGKAMDQVLQNSIGPTSPVQAPIPRPDPRAATLTAPVIESPSATTPVAAVPPEAPTHPAAVPTRIAFMEPADLRARGEAHVDVTAALSDRERALLSVVRLVEGIRRPGILSRSDRAYVEGAKVLFEQLASDCHELLEGKNADFIGMRADSKEKPVSAAPPKFSAPTEEIEGESKVQRAPSSGSPPAAAPASLLERIAQLEARLNHLTQFIGK